MLCTRLYLGRSIPAPKGLTVNTFDTLGAPREVSDSALDGFLRSAVAPLFQGFTIYTAKGFWQGEPENTTVLEILHEPSESCFCETIAAAYTHAFKQESVLIVTLAVESVQW